METKKKNYTLLIVFIVILLCVLGLLYLEHNKESKEKPVENKKYLLLQDYSRFFTIDSCIYKYFQYLSSKNTSNLLKVLDDEYKKTNNINNDNIYDYLPDLDGEYTFSSKKIYYEKINDNYFTYYVYGYAQEELLDSIGNKDYYYFKVNYDQKNTIFSISPIDSNLFEEVSNG